MLQFISYKIVLCDDFDTRRSMNFRIYIKFILFCVRITGTNTFRRMFFVSTSRLSICYLDCFLAAKPQIAKLASKVSSV